MYAGRERDGVRRQREAVLGAGVDREPQLVRRPVGGQLGGVDRDGVLDVGGGAAMVASEVKTGT